MQPIPNFQTTEMLIDDHAFTETFKNICHMGLHLSYGFAFVTDWWALAVMVDGSCSSSFPDWTVRGRDEQ